jgi:alkyldihydroxyacetonephosphate synthase
MGEITQGHWASSDDGASGFDQTSARPMHRVPDMPWAHWGEPRPLPARALELLEQTFGPRAALPAPVPPGAIRVPPSLLSPAATQAFESAARAEHVRLDAATRLRHSAGRATGDLLRQRAGAGLNFPDAVITPRTHDEVLGVLAAASTHRVAVVPFGGGTSVTGGVEPLRGGLTAVAALDLHRMDRLIAVDPVSLTATLEAGLRGPEAEHLLGAHGLTLGHLPQSFEHATIGGFAATRSAGQASAGYGRFDDMIIAVTSATPRGTFTAGGRAPASAAGPDLRQLLLGSEGTFGVITEVTVRVRPLPETVIDEAWAFAGFDSGIAALRALAQDGRQLTSLARLSDEAETSVLALTGGGQPFPGCLAVTSYEGTAAVAEAQRAAAATTLAASGGTTLGPAPVAAWRAGRFTAPYLRDSLLDAGVLAKTVETATAWSDLRRLDAAVRSALTGSLTDSGTPPLIMCHLSHTYPAGASLYYTVVCALGSDPGAQWAAAKSAASDAIAVAGGTITHHHSVGTDHRPWMRTEIGGLGLDVLRAVAATLDPGGVFNPGKLIPPR